MEPMRGAPFTLQCLACFLLAAGCGSEPAETTAGAGAGGAGGAGGGGGTAGSGGEAPPSPQIRFFVDERPHDTTDVEIETDEARWGDPIRIVIEGLAPGQQVRADLSTKAWAVFAADAEGTVDFGEDAPLSG